jgi:hypothetical protein
MSSDDVIVILIMLSVLAITITPSFFLFRAWKLKVIPGCGALAMATLISFLMYRLPGPWEAFFNVPPVPFFIDVLNRRFGRGQEGVALGGIIGGLAGLVVALLIERRSYSRTAKPVDTAVKRVDTEAKPPDTTVQRLDKRDPEH